MKARNRWITLLALVAFVAAAAMPVLGAQAGPPEPLRQLPTVGECSHWHYPRDARGQLIREDNGFWLRYCESTVVIPRMWAVEANDMYGDQDGWCAIISEDRPGIDRAAAICFPGQDWRYTNVICYGLVDSDDVWECDGAIGGSQNRMALENLRLVYARHLAQRPPRH
jgi:hypothetical protein